MNGLLVFNSVNDIVFQQLNNELQAKMLDIAEMQGLINADNPMLDSNTLLQIFSPIISSQKIMFCQFDNTYSSFQCENGLNFAFGDFLGHSFIKIGQRPVEQLKRHLGVAIALARFLFGPNLFAVTGSNDQLELLTQCISCYEELFDEEQAMLLEALPQIIINAELKRTVRTTLNAALDKLRELGHPRAHTLLFVAHKFLGIEGSKQALLLNPSDLLFLSLLLRTLQRNSQGQKCALNRCVAVFLQGDAQHSQSGCVPCIAQVTRLEKGILLMQVIEYAPLQVASSMYDTFFVLQKIMSVQQQGDLDGIKPAFENLESFVKQSLDALKRAKLRGDELESSHKKFAVKWENLRKLYGEYLRSFERELVVRIDSNLAPFVDELKQLFTLSCCDSSSLKLDQLSEVNSLVEGKMLEFAEFLAVKAERNMCIEAYKEDFPGLIHFIYINRTTGQLIAPEFLQNKLMPKGRLWSMVEVARDYLKKGQTTVMWKDKIFNYSYFLWFEDRSSGSMKPADVQQNFINQTAANSSWKPQVEPGLLGGDYYHQLVETCFPKTSPEKLKCCELFCIHLGLVTATCAAEHARRLVATIADVAGVENI